MGLHFTFDVTLGNILTILGFGLYALRVDRLLTKFLIEHEMLMGWYCAEHKMNPDNLPTRAKGPR